MNNPAPKKPISDQAELKAASDAVSAELLRINQYLAANGKAQANVDFINGANIGVTNPYKGKLDWLFMPKDEKAIIDQFKYIQYLTWQKQCGAHDKYLLTQINKSILIAAGSIAEALVAYAYTKETGFPSDKIKPNLMDLKYANAITNDLEMKIEQVWYWRQSIHLHLRINDQKVCTQANVDQALSFVTLAINELHNHFYVKSVNINRKKP